MKTSEISPKFNPIIRSLQNEIQIRANQLLLEQQFDVVFYKPENIEAIMVYYEEIGKHGQVSEIRTISEKDGTMVVIHGSDTEETKSVDIILQLDQDLTSLSFLSLKALIWYKYFLPIETCMKRQISCIAEDSQAYELFVTNIFDTIDQAIEALAIHFTGVIQELAILNSPSNSKEGDKDG